jgi:hypothetical protein
VEEGHYKLCWNTWYSKSKCLYGSLLFLFLTLRALSQVNPVSSEDKAFRLTGNISLNTVAYASDRNQFGRDPLTSILSANISIRAFGIETPLFFVLSTLQKKYAQPFNQFGLSPRWKWVTLHLGYRNITFSEFTLAGHTFLGAGLELNPGILRFGFIYGRFDRVTGISPVFETDSLPKFARKGWAVKVGLGREQRFVDLIFMRIRDDSTSLHQPGTGAIRTPEQNVVTGINSHFTLLKKLSLQAEGALSLYTPDMWAQPISDIEEDSRLRSINKFLVVNQSSEYYTAVRTSLQYKDLSWSLKLEYKRIDPRYRSMGAYFFNDDLENLTINPFVALFKHKLSLSGSLGLQKDNLKGTKRSTSQRSIGNLNVSFMPSYKFGVDAGYSNYSIYQKAGRLALNDTTRVRQTTHSFSLTPRLLFINTVRSHMIMMIYNLSSFDDQNRFTQDFTQITSHIAQVNYILGLIKTRWSFTFGLNYNAMNSVMISSSAYGATLGISKSLMKGKLLPGLTNTVTRTENGQNSGLVINSVLSNNWQIHRRHNLRFSIYFTGCYPDPGSENASFNELKGDLTYVFTL